MATKTLIVLTALVSFSACTEPWERHKISESEAKQLMETYQRNHPGFVNIPYFFIKDDIEFITNNSTGVRFYLGSENSLEYLLLVGTKTPTAGDMQDDDESKIIVSRAYSGETRLTLDHAAHLTAEYQENHPAPHKKGGFFPIEIFQYLQDAPNFSGVNFYYGQLQTGEIVIFGKATRLDSTNNRHVEIEGNVVKAIDKSLPCPDNCGSPNDINHE